MKREHYWLIAGVILGYLVYRFMTKSSAVTTVVANGGDDTSDEGDSSYIFTSGRKLYSTDKLSARQASQLTGTGGGAGVYAEINSCGACRTLGGNCTYSGIGGAYTGCQFSDKWIGKGVQI